MLMPWPVKVVWWWYLTLACASCVPLACCLVKGNPFGRGELFQLLAGTVSLVACFAGLALAVRRAASVRKAKYCTLKHVLNGPYELGEDTYFLTPAGKVWPKGTAWVK